MQPLFAATLGRLDDAVQRLTPRIERAEFADTAGGRAYRHREKHDLLGCYLKAVRIVSSLHACMHLLRVGHVQEIYVLCRCVDEYAEDIAFMSFPDGGDGKASAEQRRFVNEYFQEEFSDGDDPVASQQDRDRVSRRKIHAALARVHSPSNPSRSQQVQMSIHKTFSGFVHAAYVHTMDLFNGRTYRTRGMLGTPRIEECEEQMASYIYRAAIAIALVAHRLDDEQLAGSLKAMLAEFARQADCMPDAATRVKYQ